MEFPPVPAVLLSPARAICRALPEASEMDTDVGVEFKVRRRIFAYVFAIADPQGKQFTMLSCRADPEEREALLAGGHPYFAPRHREDRLGVIIDDQSDWEELAELITTSYLIVAPAKLAALVETPPEP
ncbi:MAG: MmcQ/YjbR family DNA-binding protein [Acidimicrobiia bacterium]